MSTPFCSLLLLSTASVMLIGCSSSSPRTPPTATTTSSAPAVSTTAPTTTRPTSYVVQRGDSLAAIASRFGLSRAELIFANGISDPDMIRVGQRLTIPAPTPTTVATTVLTVPPTTLGADPH